MPEYLGIPLKVFLTKVSFSFAIDKREEGRCMPRGSLYAFILGLGSPLMAFRVKMARVALAKRSRGE